MSIDPLKLTIRDAVAMVHRRELSAERWVRSCLERIAEREPHVGAWQWLALEQAAAVARAMDSVGVGGPLAGLPFGVKDVIDTADMPTSYGSDAYAGHCPPADASCVAQLRAAGAVCLGKTVTTEFAGAAPGKTRNPHHADFTPGGSSSGSAAAVAAGMVPMALGTQTSGSIIRPASFCGVAGYKPSLGTIDRTGVKPLAGSFDTVGVFATNVLDAAFVVAAIANRPRIAKGELPPKSRIAVCRTPRWGQASVEMQQALEGAVDRLSRSGAVVADWELSSGLQNAQECHQIMLSWEMVQALHDDCTLHPGKLAPRTLEMVHARSHITAEAYDAARRSAATYRIRFDELLGDFDAVLTISAAGVAPAGLSSTGDPVFNNLWTVLHGPCVSVPVAWTSVPRLPLGLQVVGRFGDDAKVIGVAAYLEAVLERC